MTVINELAVKSKYAKTQNILTKAYEFNNKIIDVIVHAEKILNMVYTAFTNFVDIKIMLGIYFIYYRDNNGKKEPCSFFAEEPVTIRVYREEFKPISYEFDFRSGEFVTNIKNIKTKYDIDMDYKCISIDITAAVIVNLVEEKTIILQENIINNEDEEVEEFDEIPMNCVAISKNYFGGDLKNYVLTLEEISRAINQKLIEIDEENKELKNEIGRMKKDINNKDHQYISLKEKYNNVSKDYTRQVEKLKSIEGKYLKVQKKAGLLEVENNRKMEEINYLSKEKNDLILNIEKSKSTIKDRLKQIIYGK